MVYCISNGGYRVIVKIGFANKTQYLNLKLTAEKKWVKEEKLVVQFPPHKCCKNHLHKIKIEKSFIVADMGL